MSLASNPDLIVLTGRFDLPGEAEIAALQEAAETAPRVLVLIESAHLPRSPRHPFRWEERAALLRDALDETAQARVSFEPLRELYDASRMTTQIQSAAERHSPPFSRVRMVRAGAQGPLPGGWQLHPLHAAAGAPTAEELQGLLYAGETPELTLAALAPHVAPTTLAFLAAFLRTPEYQRLRQESQQIAGEKAAWAVAPYPVVLVTVDAVVRAAGQVLLVRRGRSPGQGLLALPGGFVDVDETVYASTLRELAEETQLMLPAAEMRAALRGVQVFDDPRRSQRGRVITHAHFFDLPHATPPAVTGGDDAAAAQWVRQEDLAGLEDQFLDDHFIVLDRFLGLLGD